MIKPATLTDAVDLVRKSRLIEEDRLSSYLDRLRAEWPLDPGAGDLLKDMVRTGLLTGFQAGLIGNGRWMGFEIGNYRILDRLGQGGTGQVFLAEHTKLGHRVALKVLSRHTPSPLALERFLCEARAAAKLRHPNIIRVDDINPSHDPPFIVMEYADGITLQAAVARHSTLHPHDAANIGSQIAAALQEAHAHGLVHRDVKPANILVDRRGVARLLDLGIVRIDGENLTGDYCKQIILGTIDYLSPEQSRDSSKVDIRADIYSLGATLYFLLTGVSPVPEGPLRERLRQLQEIEPPRIEILRSDCPPELALIVHRMMAKDPTDRFQKPQEAAEALKPFSKPRSEFPAFLFRKQNATVSDTEGTATPSGGTVLPCTEAFAPLTDEHAVGLLSFARVETPPPKAARWPWIAASLLAMFGLLMFAFYKLL